MAFGDKICIILSSDETGKAEEVDGAERFVVDVMDDDKDLTVEANILELFEIDLMAVS